MIANSIGAYFSMCSFTNKQIKKALFISPIVNMEELIGNMMLWSNITEDELRKKGEIATAIGETLSWEYLQYVRENRINWNVPTDILYGSGDNLTPIDTIKAFAYKHHASLTVMEGGEHWFHTDAQMRFLDNWIKEKSEVKQ